MSLYAEYIKEREGKQIIEDEDSFATYKVSGKECYIEDVYVREGSRKNLKAWKIVDKIIEIVKKDGVTFISTSSSIKANNPTSSVRAILGYGFKIHSIKQDLIIFVKEV